MGFCFGGGPMGKELSSATFDYSQVDQETKGKLIALAGQLKRHGDSLRTAGNAIGSAVIEAHELLSGRRAGLFDEWVESETEVGLRTAYNCLNAAKRALQFAIIAKLPPTVAYLMSAKKVPDEAITDFEKQINKGVKPTVKAAKATLAKFRKEKPPKVDYGQCPNCAGKRWTTKDGATVCKKCRHPHGEPVGERDVDRVADQRAKAVKTVEALIRAFDDLHMLLHRHDEHEQAIASCKTLLKAAKGWK